MSHGTGGSCRLRATARGGVGAIWVGSSGRVRDGSQKEPFAEIEALGAGALAMLDLPAAHCRAAIMKALPIRPVAGAAFPLRPDPRLAGRLSSYREVNAFMARALLRFQKP